MLQLPLATRFTRRALLRLRCVRCFLAALRAGALLYAAAQPFRPAADFRFRAATSLFLLRHRAAISSAQLPPHSAYGVRRRAASKRLLIAISCFSSPALITCRHEQQGCWYLRAAIISARLFAGRRQFLDTVLH